jgi:hypothetical protein
MQTSELAVGLSNNTAAKATGNPVETVKERIFVATGAQSATQYNKARKAIVDQASPPWARAETSTPTASNMMANMYAIATRGIDRTPHLNRGSDEGETKTGLLPSVPTQAGTSNDLLDDSGDLRHVFQLLANHVTGLR